MPRERNRNMMDCGSRWRPGRLLGNTHGVAATPPVVRRLDGCGCGCSPCQRTALARGSALVPHPESSHRPIRLAQVDSALCTTMLAVTGITNKSLRALMTGLLDGIDTAQRSQLRPGAAAGQRADQPHPGPHRYRLTDDGLRFAIFYTKVHDRVLRPLLAPDQPQVHHRYEKHYAPSTFTSPKPSTGLAYCQRRPQNLTTVKDLTTKGP